MGLNTELTNPKLTDFFNKRFPDTTITFNEDVPVAERNKILITLLKEELGLETDEDVELLARLI